MVSLETLNKFQILAVIAGLGLVAIGLYFEQTYYEYGGLAILLIGLVLSWYNWYTKQKEEDEIDNLFKFDKTKEGEQKQKII